MTRCVVMTWVLACEHPLRSEDVNKIQKAVGEVFAAAPVTVEATHLRTGEPGDLVVTLLNAQCDDVADDIWKGWDD